MPARFAMVCESEADFQTASRIAERAIEEQVEWFDDDLRKSCPVWREWSSGRRYLKWIEVRALANRLNIEVKGFIGGRPAGPDAHAARRAILAIQRSSPDPVDGIVLVRDDDGVHARLDGMNQARQEEHSLRNRIVLGVAHHKREAWVLAGFDPASEAETYRLEEIRSEVGLDPRLHSHRLTAKHDDDKLSAKRIVRHLVANDFDREAACWNSSSLNVLRDRGSENGLAIYIQKVQLRLTPCFKST